MPHVAPPDLTLPADEARHLAQVLRVESGDSVVVFDGRGGEWDARVHGVGRHEVAIEILQPRTPVPEPATRVTLAIGLLKGDAMDAVVRDATALGIAEIVPMISAHCAVPKRARGGEAVARWQRVAIAAAKQCGRATLPGIAAVTPWSDVLCRAADRRFICVEPIYPGAPMPVFAAAPPTALLLVGPEGGWAPDEVAAARLAGYAGIQLGPRILRAELAPLVALSQLWAALGAATT